MDKPEHVRLLEALGWTDCNGSHKGFGIAPGRDSYQRLVLFNKFTHTKWRLWLLEEMERRGLFVALYNKCWDWSVDETSTAYFFATLSNEDLMRAALAVLEGGE